MDKEAYFRVNEIIKDHINNEMYDVYRGILDTYAPLLKGAYNAEGYETTSNKFSRIVPLEESIQIAREFLEMVNPDYRERFDNLLQTIIDGEPIIEFHPIESKTNLDDNCLTTEGKVIIFFENNASDAKTIVHEMFHKFNELKLESDGVLHYNVFNRLYTETVSILAEKLLIMYMYNKEYVTENDAALLINDRISNTLQGAYLIECEAQYLRLVEAGIEITEKTPGFIRDNFDKSSEQYDIWNTEKNHKVALGNILGHDGITYPQNITYLIGDYYSDMILDCPDRLNVLVELNELLCDPNLTPTAVDKYLRKKLN